MPRLARGGCRTRPRAFESPIHTFLSTRASLAGYFSDTDGMENRAGFEHDYAALVGNREFHNLIILRLMFPAYLTDNTDRLLEAAQAIMEQVSTD